MDSSFLARLANLDLNKVLKRSNEHPDLDTNFEQIGSIKNQIDMYPQQSVFWFDFIVSQVNIWNQDFTAGPGHFYL